MKILRTVAAARAFRRSCGDPLVLVPTMGALHAGHAALIAKARKLAGEKGAVVVSVFVNPTQFGPKEDFSAYPRQLQKDAALCREQGADAVFAPSVEEMYAKDRSVFVDEGALSGVLCGKSRPGHFRGVCTVVAKLFLIVQPELAVFGEKDWQQLAIIRRMIRDLNIPVKSVGHATVWEKDGLAMSSRNRYLTAEERAAAPGIQAALKTAAREKSAGAILKMGRKLIAEIPGARLDYLELVDAETLEPVKNLRGKMRLATAVFLGKARLIDNIGVQARA